MRRPRFPNRSGTPVRDAKKQKPRASVAFVRRLSVAKNHPAPPVIFPGQAGQK
jgi:hypothetical protein